MIYNAKSVFSPRFLASYWSAGIGPCFLLAGVLCNFTPMPEENDQYSANHY
jgi:hypothetical protein